MLYIVVYIAIYCPAEAQNFTYCMGIVTDSIVNKLNFSFVKIYHSVVLLLIQLIFLLFQVLSHILSTPICVMWYIVVYIAIYCTAEAQNFTYCMGIVTVSIVNKLNFSFVKIYHSVVLLLIQLIFLLFQVLSHILSTPICVMWYIVVYIAIYCTAEAQNFTYCMGIVTDSIVNKLNFSFVKIYHSVVLLLIQLIFSLEQNISSMFRQALIHCCQLQQV